MKHTGYYARALLAADKRYARVFEKLGYGSKDDNKTVEIQRDEEVETKVSPRSRKTKTREYIS